MQAYKNLFSVILFLSIGLISCESTDNIDRRTIILEKLQSKEWTLKRVITTDGDEIDFIPQTLEFISDSELEYISEEPIDSFIKETYLYSINLVTSHDFEFSIYLSARNEMLDVITLTDNVLVINTKDINLLNDKLFIYE